MKDNYRIYASIDLKSFYASVECVERGLDSMDTNLVVADISRTSKTICLAVSPSLKKYNVPGRPRLFEVESIINKINANKCSNNKSFIYSELQKDDSLKVDYIVAKPKMALYIDYSSRIYNIYLKYFSKEDIHIYSVDEVFIDLTSYIKIYNKNPIDIVRTVIVDIKNSIGIVATAGIGTNMYLSKVAMDIMAKNIKEDETGCRIAYLDEDLYKKKLWNHTPLTDFWRIGKSTAKKLEKIDIYTMGDIARLSLGKKNDYYNEDLLYSIFGVNAELLIDHAWGIEPVTIKDIKLYTPKSSSFTNSQVLSTPYSFDKARIIIREMSENLILEMLGSHLMLKGISLLIDYDIENIANNKSGRDIKIDFYGRKVPKPYRSSYTFDTYTSNKKLIVDKFIELYDSNPDKNLSIRRVTVILDKLKDENKDTFKQLSLFDQDDTKTTTKNKNNRSELDKALVNLRRKYGKNSVLKGNSLLEESTIIDRNTQIGGHKA